MSLAVAALVGAVAGGVLALIARLLPRTRVIGERPPPRLGDDPQRPAA